MAVYTTTADVSDFTHVDYTPEELDRVRGHIAWAERYVARRAGWVFYDANSTTSLTSLAWIEVICRIVERALFQDDPEDRKNAAGPYSSEKNGDYSYTLRASIREDDIRSDPIITELIAYYGEMATGIGAAAFIVNGPTRNRVAEYDPDLVLVYGDVSRGWIPY